MSGKRETAYAALFTALVAAHAWRTTGRRLRKWSDMLEETKPGDPSPFPALFLVVQGQQRMTSDQGSSPPAVWSLEGDAYVYVHDTTAGSVPQAALNDILDELEAAIAPDLSGRTKLGGAVYDVKIPKDKPIETDGGALVHTAVAIVPFRLIVTP